MTPTTITISLLVLIVLLLVIGYVSHAKIIFGAAIVVLLCSIIGMNINNHATAERITKAQKVQIRETRIIKEQIKDDYHMINNLESGKAELIRDHKSDRLINQLDDELTNIQMNLYDNQQKLAK